MKQAAMLTLAACARGHLPVLARGPFGDHFSAQREVGDEIRAPKLVCHVDGHIETTKPRKGASLLPMLSKLDLLYVMSARRLNLHANRRC